VLLILKLVLQAAAAREFVAAAFRLPLMPNVLVHFFDCL
jgi:hypothetical protein